MIKNQLDYILFDLIRWGEGEEESKWNWPHKQKEEPHQVEHRGELETWNMKYDQMRYEITDDKKYKSTKLERGRSDTTWHVQESET